MKALTVKMETVTLNGKGIHNLTRFVYQVYAINRKIFFLADVSFLGCCLRLESCCIWVNMVTVFSKLYEKDMHS